MSPDMFGCAICKRVEILTVDEAKAAGWGVVDIVAVTENQKRDPDVGGLTPVCPQCMKL